LQNQLQKIIYRLSIDKKLDKTRGTIPFLIQPEWNQRAVVKGGKTEVTTVI
jgi:hypothetical protein